MQASCTVSLGPPQCHHLGLRSPCCSEILPRITMLQHVTIIKPAVTLANNKNLRKQLDASWMTYKKVLLRTHFGFIFLTDFIFNLVL